MKVIITNAAVKNKNGDIIFGGRIEEVGTGREFDVVTASTEAFMVMTAYCISGKVIDIQRNELGHTISIETSILKIEEA